MALHIATIVFDLSSLGFGAAMGFALFLASLIENHLSGTDGLYAIAGSAALFAASTAVAHLSGQSLIDYIDDVRHVSMHRLPYFATAIGVLGACLVVRSIVTGRWNRTSDEL